MNATVVTRTVATWPAEGDPDLDRLSQNGRSVPLSASRKSVFRHRRKALSTNLDSFGQFWTADFDSRQPYRQVCGEVLQQLIGEDASGKA